MTTFPHISLNDRVSNYSLFNSTAELDKKTSDGHSMVAKLNRINSQYGGTAEKPVLLSQTFEINPQVSKSAAYRKDRMESIVSSLAKASKDKTGLEPVTAVGFYDADGNTCIALFSSTKSIEGATLGDVKSYKSSVPAINLEAHIDMASKDWYVPAQQEVLQQPKVPSAVVPPVIPPVSNPVKVEVPTPLREVMPAIAPKGNLSFHDSCLSKIDGFTKDEYLKLNKDNMQNMLKQQTIEGVFKILSQCLGMNLNSVANTVERLTCDKPHHHCDHDEHGMGM